jgi:hypothetical protein
MSQPYGMTSQPARHPDWVKPGRSVPILNGRADSGFRRRRVSPAHHVVVGISPAGGCVSLAEAQVDGSQVVPAIMLAIAAASITVSYSGFPVLMSAVSSDSSVWRGDARSRDDRGARALCAARLALHRLAWMRLVAACIEPPSGAAERP